MTNPSSDPISSARYIHIGEMLNALQNAKGIKFGLATRYLANFKNARLKETEEGTPLEWLSSNDRNWP